MEGYTSTQREASSVITSLMATVWHFLKRNPLLFIFSLLVFRFVCLKYFSSLRRYPGPFLASGSRTWKVYSLWRGHTHYDHIAIHKRYGPVVRIAPNELSFDSPEAAREILTPGKGFHKTDFYSVFPPAKNPGLFSETREAIHAQKKRIAAGPYSLSSMQALTPWIDQTEEKLMSKIDHYAYNNQIIDLGKWLHYFAFDVLGEVAFSKSFGFLEQGRDVENTMDYIDKAQLADSLTGQVPWWNKIRNHPIRRYLPLLAPKPALVTRIALRELAQRGSGEVVPDRRDILGQLLAANEKDDSKLSKGDIFSIAHGAIFAGSDSTASTMQTMMFNILSRPSIYDRLNEEILSANQNGLLSEIVTYEEALKHLPYFQACLKEAMRIGPAVGVNMSRQVPPQGAEIDGTWFPGGTRVALNSWVLHRDKEIFGEDAEVFRPERWLLLDNEKSGANEQKLRKMDRYMFQFGGGSHICIGRFLALLEINKVLPQLLRRYKFKLAYPGRPMKQHSNFFVIQEGLEVHVERR